ncbi:hypothetical protein PR202_ga26650 [Eleusine coracana subsp. coracana]|uniref:Cystatin domain-containing protein n=1 Tax=Eleusine coracana subsp. coracana TaxID=191504 RepID=A0AAV5DCE3_ELECO|nr:hypothetical protein QOZ80_3AG0238320 [Eleusine coracana subsp. coracana]GJN08698.1 hypothetical protein PR202_ga26650 [Eleusine coracana subsp. coracana]
MWTTTNLLLIAIAIAAAVSALAAPAAAGLVGGWQPIPDINDPHVQELGSWAVAEHTKVANERLQFVKVVSGEQQVVSGMNYRLVIDAANQLAGRDFRYDAAVYEQSWTNTRKLVSFTQERK